MSRHNLPEQVERLREQADALKASLDQTMQTLECLSGKTDELGRNAREIVAVVGDERGGAMPWGLLLTLGLGLGVVWLVSPETFSALTDFFKEQYRQLVRSVGTTPS